MKQSITNYEEKRYSTKNSQLHVYKHFQDGATRKYNFDNIVFATMQKGKKDIHCEDVPGGLELENNFIVSLGNLEVTTKCAKVDEEATCIVLEIEKSKVKAILDKVQFSNEDIADLVTLKYSSDILNLESAPKQSIKPVFNKILNLHINQSKFKDVHLDTVVDDLIIESLQSDMWSSLLFNLESNKTKNPFANVVDHILKNIHENVDLNMLINNSSMSRAIFFKKFKEIYGKTPNQFIIECKIDEACRLMIHTKKTISEIAFNLGFSSPSYFAYTFFKFQKVSPVAYRSSIFAQQLN